MAAADGSSESAVAGATMDSSEQAAGCIDVNGLSQTELLSVLSRDERLNGMPVSVMQRIAAEAPFSVDRTAPLVASLIGHPQVSVRCRLLCLLS